MNNQEVNHEDQDHQLDQLENCRDFKRTNRSNITVKANILSLISQDGILTVRHSKKRKNELSENVYFSENNILDLALENGRNAIAMLNKSQNHIRKRAVERYASHQHGLVSTSFNFDENVDSIKEVSPNIVSPKIIDEYKKLSKLKRVNSDSSDSSNKDSDRICNTSDSAPYTSLTTSPSISLPDYCTHELPTKIGTYYKPYDIAQFLFKHEKDKIIIAGKRIFKHTLMIVLMQMKVVPVTKNSLYRLVDLYRELSLSPDDIWTVATRAGKKPKLSYTGFNQLVETIRVKSEGGLSFPFSKVKKMVRATIIHETQLKRGNLTIPSVSEDTLYDYASRIMAQSVFNVNVGKIPYKTETRSTAEWSFRSTISFLLCVVLTHFIPDINPSDFHRRKSEIPEKSLMLWDIVENCYARLYKRKTKVISILPNLVTSTDEMTLFACPGKINKAEKLHIVARPSHVKNESVNSGRRNNYNTEPSGDAHCRGVRIVLNSTITAGGMSAPLFIVVYGLGSDEMPHDDIITCRVKGLVPAANRNVLSQGHGFITFVRGKYDKGDESQNSAQNNDDEENENTQIPPLTPHSKEYRVASIYRKEVYRPFIHQVRVECYEMDPDGPIPDNLRAVGWMDGATSPLKFLTEEENIQIENDLKITLCKQSAARTAVEQAADVAPIFKGTKGSLQVLEDPNKDSNVVVYRVEKILKQLEDGDLSPTKIVRLRSPKKKALLSTIPNLTEATAVAFTVKNVRSGFVANGQIDPLTNSIPSLMNMIHTYRGNIQGTCLENGQYLVETFFEEMYTNGIISEESFDSNGIPKDRDSKGNVVERPTADIHLENRHRSKILSSDKQIRQRRHYLDSKRMKEYKSRVSCYTIEEREYQLNLLCEKKFVAIIHSHQNHIQYHKDLVNELNRIKYESVCNHLSVELLSAYKDKVLRDEFRAFVRVRAERYISGERINFTNVPNKNKEVLIERCVEDRAKPILTRLISARPQSPTLLEPGLFESD